MLAIVVICVSAVIVFALFLVVQSFGRYTGRIVASNAATRISNAEFSELVLRTERRIASDQLAAIEVVREMMKTYPPERSA